MDAARHERCGNCREAGGIILMWGPGPLVPEMRVRCWGDGQTGDRAP